MEKNKKKKRLTVVALLLMVGIITLGYAALSSSLNITGTSHITAAGWDVHFTNIQVSTGSVTGSQVTKAPTITQVGGKDLKVEYEVTLSNPGEFYEFTVDAVNTGTINAKLSAVPTISGVSTAQDVYVNYTVTDESGAAITAGRQLPKTNGVNTYKVRVEFDKNITASQLPTTQQNLTLTVDMTYEQA